jgi:V/A-type H+-transporting ATPase subunit A
MILSVSPPGGDFTEPVTQACLRTSGAFLMLDTSLAHSRHFPAINWSQSYSLYSREMGGHFREKVAAEWDQLQQKCRDILYKEQALREVAEIVGSEGLQDTDRLTMMVAERVRSGFLAQNAYSEDAFSRPDKTYSLMKRIMEFFERSEERLNRGIPLDEATREDALTPTDSKREGGEKRQ